MCKSKNRQCGHYYPELEIYRLNLANEILRMENEALKSSYANSEMNLQALTEEKQQREQGCEYCKEPTKLMEIHDCELEKKETCYIHLTSDGAAIFTNKSPVSYLDIDCCPKCGRELSHE